MGTWFNDDGLQLKYGTDKTVPNIGGEFRTNGALREIEFKIDLTKLTATAAIIDDTVFFPKNARLEEVEIVVYTAADSAADTAALNIGLVKTDRSTAIDADGIVKALAQTNIDAAGEKVVLRKGSTGVGDLVGVTNTSVGYFTADYDTEAYTAGVVFVRIRYTMV